MKFFKRFLFSLLIISSFMITFAPLRQAIAATEPGSLIKLSCAPAAGPSDPCRSVYYYGSDGKRHAFPNEKTYFTWYKDFAGVQTVSAAFMASLPLGQNVTYRPGMKMVKITTAPQVYAVALGGTLRWVGSEQIARDLYGTEWNKQIDDIPDAFFSDYRSGSNIPASTDYRVTDELAFASTINANLDETHREMQIATERGTFSIDVITLQKDRYAMITDTADAADCSNGCQTKSLGDYVQENNAAIGINGTYFCPAEYPDCSGKTGTFLWPVYNTAAGTLRNTASIPFHEGPMLTSTDDGRYFYLHRAQEFGPSVSAFESARGGELQGAIANYPSLLENGTIVVETEPRLETEQRTVKAVRGGIGLNDRFIYLVIARNATVVDLASIMKALGARDAMNLDGGGSAALYYNGRYEVGPGRLIPNAILFKKR